MRKIVILPWSPENFHTIIEFLPSSINLVEDSDSNRDEIDIFSGLDDSIPPGIESNFDSEEDITDNLLNDDPIPEYDFNLDMEPRCSYGSSSNSQNVAFLSAEDTNSINEVNTANVVFTAAGHSSQGQASSSSYTNDLMFSFFVDQSSGPQLDDEDLEQLDQDNLEEMDIKWQVAMLFMRVKRFYKKTVRKLIFNGKEPVGFDIAKAPFLKEKKSVRFSALYLQKKRNLLGLTQSQISSKDKTGLGYGDQLNEKNSSDSGLFNSVFDSRSSDGDDNQTNDRFKKDNDYHTVPPPLTGNYIPPLAYLYFVGLDDFVYRPTKNKTSASVSQVETCNTPPSNTSVEMPRVESVRPSGVIF
ncbi:hypothetical protein Tco_0235851 [Tanacetum coccineum]